MGSVTLALVVLVVGVLVIGAYGVVRVADTLAAARIELIDDAAEWNARMTAQNRPHVWIVPPPTLVERTVYGLARVVSPRWRRRARTADRVRVAMGGGVR